MKKISIVGEIINSEGIIFLDENNVPVQICKPSKFLFNEPFIGPTILIDNFERGRFKQIEIKNLDITLLGKYGYRLVSFKATSETRNRPHQTKCYTFENINHPIPNSQVLYKTPQDHYLEIDIINNRIRIRGRNSFPYHRSQDASPWVNIAGIKNEEQKAQVI
jgi:hypothetical protein